MPKFGAFFEADTDGDGTFNTISSVFMIVPNDGIRMSTEKSVKTLEMTEKGFTITKDISRRNGEHIQVELEITSRHEEKTSVDLAEQLPPGTDPAQIGFLPDNEPDEWRTTDPDILLLQARLVPEGTRRIVYGVQEVEGDEVEAMIEEPQITAVGGADSEASAPETDEATGASGTGEQTEADGEGESERETESEETTTETQSEEMATQQSNAPFELPLDEETAEALASELEPHLEHGETDPVTETKLTQLQEDVGDMRTYLPAFEEFLGEAGRAEDITDRLDELQEEVEGMEELPDEFDETIERIEGDIDEITDTAERLDEQLEIIEERLGELEEWREDIAAASQ